MILLPCDDPEEEGNVVILQTDDNNDNSDGFETYTSVDDESELKEVFSIFKEKFEKEFDFEDLD